jgi:hypothetical protein
MIHGVEPTYVLVQCNKAELKVKAKMKVDNSFRLVLSIAYICTVKAIGASHHLPIGSNAPLNNIPARLERSRFTNELLPT